MKTVVGFTFTEAPLQRLKANGFSFHRSEDSLIHGYYEFVCPLSPHLGSGFSIEIREIIDENAYVKFHGKNVENKIFSPFKGENIRTFSELTHPNHVYCVESILGGDMPDSELKEYLKIRKQYPIWVLWLKCRDFELFNKIAAPNKYFSWLDQPGALIHLGQSCFDLLITPD